MNELQYLLNNHHLLNDIQSNQTSPNDPSYHKRSSSTSSHKRTNSTASSASSTQFHKRSSSNGSQTHYQHQHTRSNSRNLDTNWRHPQRTSSTTRKQLFTQHIPPAHISALVAQGKVVTGQMKVNPKNRSDAYVTTDILEEDVFICGSRDRNRAIEGDIVAVELLDVDDVWKVRKDKEERKKRRSSSVSDSAVPTLDILDSGGGLKRRGSLKQRNMQKRIDDIQVEGQSLLLMDQQTNSGTGSNEDVKPLYAGHIVAIMDRVADQTYSGTICLIRPSTALTPPATNSSPPTTPKIIWFKPTNKRIPLIAIPIVQAPSDFINNPDKYKDDIFVAKINRWPGTSLHPFGELVGDVNNKIGKDEAVLWDNNFGPVEFPVEVLEQVNNLITNSSIPMAITDDGTRRQFDGEQMVAYSPKLPVTDHVIHLTKLSDHYMQIGVHILDVTHYIPADSPLDKEALRRGISIPHEKEAYNMLPEQFTEWVSFKPGKRSKAISVVWKLDFETLQVVDEWVGPSEVLPDSLVSYDQMEQVLSGEESSLSHPIQNYIKTIQFLSDQFRRQRLNIGPTNTLPDSGIFDFVDTIPSLPRKNVFTSNRVETLISELDIKTNYAIAVYISKTCGPSAFIRSQPHPNVFPVELNLPPNSHISAFQASLSLYSPQVRHALSTIFYKSLRSPKYTLAGNSYTIRGNGHYFLNIQVYAHFTNPLHRYADHIVHRQIHSGASTTPTQHAAHCTRVHANAVAVHFQHLQLAISRSLEDGNPVKYIGIIVRLHASAFDVVIPALGIEKRVHGDQLIPVERAEYNGEVLEFYWGPDKVQQIRILEEIEVFVRMEMGGGVPCLIAGIDNPFQ